jgi:hypothetical protein
MIRNLAFLTKPAKLKKRNIPINTKIEEDYYNIYGSEV